MNLLKPFLISILVLSCCCKGLWASENKKSAKIDSKKVNTEVSMIKAEDYENIETDALTDDILIHQRNLETGVYDTSYNTKSDNGRISLLFHGNSNLFKVTDILSFELNYAQKFNIVWMEFFLSATRASFGAVALNHESGTTTNADAEVNFIRPKTQSETILSAGGGFSYRFHLAQRLFDWDDIFETTSAFICYHLLNESFRSSTYTGLGLKADYGIHKRVSQGFHYGLKFSYNLASVKRKASDPSEKTSERSFTLAWLSLALDLSFYF